MDKEITYIHRQCQLCETIYSHIDGKQPKWCCEKCGSKEGDEDPWYSYCYSKDKQLKFRQDRLWSCPVQDSYWALSESSLQEKGEWITKDGIKTTEQLNER